METGQPNTPVFEYRVPDIAAAKRSLLLAECVVVEEDPGIPRLYLQDPFGVVFNSGQARA